MLALALFGALTAAVVHFVNPRFPTNAEDVVLDRVPLAMRERCTRNDAAAEGVVGASASVVCAAQEGANRAVFTQFASAEALNEAYNRAVSTAGVNRDTGDCIATEPAESPYAGETGQPSGRALCYQERGSSHIIWTEVESLTWSRQHGPTWTMRSCVTGGPASWAAKSPPHHRCLPPAPAQG